MRIFSKARLVTTLIAAPAAALLFGAGTASAEAPWECISVNGGYVECPDSSSTHQNNPISFAPLSWEEFNARMYVHVPPPAPVTPPVEDPVDGPDENPDADTGSNGFDSGYVDPSYVDYTDPGYVDYSDPASFDAGSYDSGAVSSF